MVSAVNRQEAQSSKLKVQDKLQTERANLKNDRRAPALELGLWNFV
jgi:hypothetical protein